MELFKGKKSNGLKSKALWEEGNSKSSLRGKINKFSNVLQIKNQLLTVSCKHCVPLNAVFALRKPCGCTQDKHFVLVLRVLQDRLPPFPCPPPPCPWPRAPCQPPGAVSPCPSNTAEGLVSSSPCPSPSLAHPCFQGGRRCLGLPQCPPWFPSSWRGWWDGPWLPNPALTDPRESSMLPAPSPRGAAGPCGTLTTRLVD